MFEIDFSCRATPRSFPEFLFASEKIEQRCSFPASDKGRVQKSAKYLFPTGRYTGVLARDDKCGGQEGSVERRGGEGGTEEVSRVTKVKLARSGIQFRGFSIRFHSSVDSPGRLSEIPWLVNFRK